MKPKKMKRTHTPEEIELLEEIASAAFLLVGAFVEHLPPQQVPEPVRLAMHGLVTVSDALGEKPWFGTAALRAGRKLGARIRADYESGAIVSKVQN